VKETRALRSLPQLKAVNRLKTWLIPNLISYRLVSSFLLILLYLTFVVFFFSFQMMFPYDSEGMWEESFGGNQDSKPRGPSAVGLDVTFNGAEHLYGLPEHASPFALKSTKYVLRLPKFLSFVSIFFFLLLFFSL
jgi:hypothetical protein